MEQCEAWELARQLVQLDSSDPGAYEGQIGDWIYGWLKDRIAEAGLAEDPVLLCRHEVLPGRSNVAARIPGTGQGPALVYICHMDTVMLGEGWDEDKPPLGAVVQGRRLYGRGACDMKSGLACALTAFSRALFRIKETGKWPVRSLVFIGTLHNHNCMSYGPGSLKLAHKPNEWVPYEDVARCQKVLWRLAERVVFGA